MKIALGALCACLVTVGLLGLGASAAGTCEGLASRAIPNVTITSARPVPAGAFAPPGNGAAPPGFSELPAFMAAATAARAVEKALKERLADKLEVTVWFDPVTERYAQPDEDPEKFAARLLSSGPGPDEAKLREKLERAKRDLEAAEQELSGRKKQKWFSVGTAILGGILSGGRGLARTRRGLSGMGTVLNQDRMEDAARKIVGLVAS